MPIKIPDNLPAARILEAENVFVMTEHRALHQDIRPLKIIILNLMPTKIETETQLLRLLGTIPCKWMSSCFRRPPTYQKTRRRNIFCGFTILLSKSNDINTTA